MRRKDERKQVVQQPVERYFPHIETILEKGHFRELETEFAAVRERLEKLSKGSSGLGKARDSKKAMKAIEMSTDLLKELLHWKKTGEVPFVGSVPQSAGERRLHIKK